MTAQPESFNLEKVMMKLPQGGKTSDYLEVKWRLLWFREVCPKGTIDTKLVQLDVETEFEEEEDLKVWDPNAKGYNGQKGAWKKVWNEEKHAYEKTIKRAKGYAVFHTVVTDDKGNTATGTKMERAVSFPDYLEKAETGSIGRALAALGYGTQFVGDEMDEGRRIVDAPVEPKKPAEADQEAYKKRRVVVESEQPANDPAQSEALKQMILKAQKRAKALGVSSMDEWNQLVGGVLGKAKSADQFALDDIARVNGELARREKAKSAEGATA